MANTETEEEVDSLQAYITIPKDINEKSIMNLVMFLVESARAQYPEQKLVLSVDCGPVRPGINTIR